MEEVSKWISETIAAVERSLGLDWRSSFSRASLRGDGAVEAVLSRDEVWSRLAERLAGCEVERRAPRIIELRSPAGTPIALKLLAGDEGRPLWVISSVADVRREPQHSSELLTQLIMGETACLLLTEGDWHLVRCGDDYHGWVRSWYVRETPRETVASFAARAAAVVDANVAYVLSAADERSLPVSDVVHGTAVVPHEETACFRRIELPGGKSGFLHASDLGLRAAPPPDRERLTERAKRFLGIPYLWGGTSPKGFDCSGLVKRVFLSEGIDLPRDSDRQALVGRLIPRERLADARSGDLLFFGEGGKVAHVAIYLGALRFIHAYGEVRINSLDPSDPGFDEKLARIFLHVRSVVPNGL